MRYEYLYSPPGNQGVFVIRPSLNQSLTHRVTGVTIYLFWPKIQQYSFVQKNEWYVMTNIFLISQFGYVMSSSLIKELFLRYSADFISVFCMFICFWLF